jgi:predicted MFS family arabinose efflux permease
VAVPRLRHLAQPSPVLFLCLFASQTGMLVLSPILPAIAREFGVSTATAGQLRAISGATGGVTAILLAIAPRRPGARDLLTAGAALVALGAPHFAVMAVRAAANQFGYLLGAAAGASRSPSPASPASASCSLPCSPPSSRARRRPRDLRPSGQRAIRARLDATL